MKRWVMLMLAILTVVTLSACGESDNEQKDDQGQGDQNEEDQGNSEGSNDSIDNATEEEEVLVSLDDVDGNVVATATLTEDKSGVKIKLEGENLAEGTHAFHIHEKGTCEAPDFKSAGGHYNPTDDNHGKEDPEGPHAGDFDNIEVGEDGKVNIEMTTDKVTLEKGQDNTLYTDEGTALVIHAEADDYTSQPSGDAGERIACGVIGE